MRIVFVFSLLWLFIPTFFIQAQVSSSIVGDGIKIEINPQYPNPGQSVTATLNDYAINNSGASISWYVDGKNIVGAGNSRAINFTAPSIGQSMTLSVKLTATNGQVNEAKQIIKPIYLDLIIEPQTYTPVFYQGRALPINSSLINLNALVSTANGVESSTKYTYNWIVNNKSVYGGPRKGNSWAQIEVPYGKTALVSVTVQDSGGQIVAKKIVNIPIGEVNLEFYEVNTLYGLAGKTISDHLILIGNSTSIRAVPYNLDNRVVSGSLLAQWSLNNQKVENPGDDPFEISLTRGAGKQASVGFKIRNLAELIQGDEKTFLVQY